MHVNKPLSFKQYQREFHEALNDEIASLRKQGGQKIVITDGRRIGKKESKYTYSFSTDSEVRLPDDTEVDIVLNQKTYSGVLISIDGFDLLLGIEEDIGEKVPSAKLQTEPWFLLKKLQERLEAASINESTKANQKIALELLSENQILLPSGSRRFDEFRTQIEEKSQKSIQNNQYQAEAITHILQNTISFVWGPPGTGKTSTLGLAVTSLVYKGESILLLAHSNTAVDTAMKSFMKYLDSFSYYKEGLILRFGFADQEIYDKYPLIDIRGVVKSKEPSLIKEIESLEKNRKELTQQSRLSALSSLQKNKIKDEISIIQKKIRPLKEKLRQKESEQVKKAEVVGCTFSKATISPEIYGRQFDAVIIDEASMAYIPHCAYVATLAKRRVAIFGDFRQLGPISQAETPKAEKWLQRDIFDEAGIVDRVNQQQKDARMVLLEIQYRMHPSISAIPNHLFYKNKLRNGKGVELNAVSKIETNTQDLVDPLLFFDLSKASAFCFSDKESHSRFNFVSALLSADIAYKSHQANIESVGIITPYKSQARLIHRILLDTSLQSVKSSTIHRFQGSEQDLIIFDSVEGQPQSKVGQLLRGMSGTPSRLLNVAVSRAKGRFIGLLNNAYIQRKLDSFNIFRKFNDRLRLNSQVLPLNFVDSDHSSAWSFTLPGVKVYTDLTEAKQAIKKDLAYAQDDVAIDWPIRFDSDRYFPISGLSSDLDLTVRGSHVKSAFADVEKVRFYKSDSFSEMGIVGIDHSTMWIYTNPKTTSLIFRISLQKTTDLLYSFLDLVPKDNKKSLEKQFKDKGSLFGHCEICQNPLLPQEPSRYNSPPRISCDKHPRQGRKMKPKDATLYARFSKQTCNVCGAELTGVPNKTMGGVFLVCSRPGCNAKAQKLHI